MALLFGFVIGFAGGLGSYHLYGKEIKEYFKIED